MSAYLIVDIDVTDNDKYAEYVRQVPAIVERFGGEYVVRGGDPETTEGGWESTRIVVLRFKSREQARAFLNSPEYAPVYAIRSSSADSKGLLVDGFD